MDVENFSYSSLLFAFGICVNVAGARSASHFSAHVFPQVHTGRQNLPGFIVLTSGGKNPRQPNPCGVLA